MSTLQVVLLAAGVCGGTCVACVAALHARLWWRWTEFGWKRARPLTPISRGLARREVAWGLLGVLIGLVCAVLCGLRLVEAGRSVPREEVRP